MCVNSSDIQYNTHFHKLNFPASKQQDSTVCIWAITVRLVRFLLGLIAIV